MFGYFGVNDSYSLINEESFKRTTVLESKSVNGLDRQYFSTLIWIIDMNLNILSSK